MESLPNLTIAPLAADFAPATYDDWLAMATKTLKGEDPAALTRKTPDGIAIRALYATRDAHSGSQARTNTAAVQIGAEIQHPSVPTARDQSLESLAGGAAAIVLTIDPAGAKGIALASADDMQQALDGVLLDIAPVALNAGWHGPQAADWLAAAAKGSPIAPLGLHLDPLSALAASGVSPGPVESHVATAALTAARLTQTHPKASLFLASGRVVHEAGGSAPLELAFAAAAALAYAKALVGAGLDMQAAWDGISLGLSIDAQTFISVAKLRAARVIWQRLISACGLSNCAGRIEAKSSDRMLTRADPWTNLVRLTTAGFGATTGGADRVLLGAFTDALGLPTAFARRLSRNTMLILLEEAHVGRVNDPLAGAWAIEALTHEIAEAAWKLFIAIEVAGGLAEALRAGLIATKVSEGMQALETQLRSGQKRIVGVTDFVNDHPRAVDTEPRPAISKAAPDPRLPGPDSHCPALPPIRVEEFAA